MVSRWNLAYARDLHEILLIFIGCCSAILTDEGRALDAKHFRHSTSLSSIMSLALWYSLDLLASLDAEVRSLLARSGVAGGQSYPFIVEYSNLNVAMRAVEVDVW